MSSNKAITIVLILVVLFLTGVTLELTRLTNNICELTLEVDMLDKQLLESQDYNVKLDMEIQLLTKYNNLLLDELEELEGVLERKKSQTKVSRGNSKAPLEFVATAYCPCKICCGKWAGGNTKSGTKPKAGRTIAVDPNVIPLGSKVLVNGTSYIAEDTGSAIKGNIIDIFHSDHKSALEWGRQKVQVEVIRN